MNNHLNILEKNYPYSDCDGSAFKLMAIAVLSQQKAS